MGLAGSEEIDNPIMGLRSLRSLHENNVEKWAIWAWDRHIFYWAMPAYAGLPQPSAEPKTIVSVEVELRPRHWLAGDGSLIARTFQCSPCHELLIENGSFAAVKDIAENGLQIQFFDGNGKTGVITKYLDTGRVEPTYSFAVAGCDAFSHKMVVHRAAQ